VSAQLAEAVTKAATKRSSPAQSEEQGGAAAAGADEVQQVSAGCGTAQLAGSQAHHLTNPPCCLRLSLPPLHSSSSPHMPAPTTPAFHAPLHTNLPPPHTLPPTQPSPAKPENEAAAELQQDLSSAAEVLQAQAAEPAAEPTPAEQPEAPAAETEVPAAVTDAEPAEPAVPAPQLKQQASQKAGGRGGGRSGKKKGKGRK
jgi:hypothetical protein